MHNCIATEGLDGGFSRTARLTAEGEAFELPNPPGPKARYRVTNRARYDLALVERGGITLLISPAAIQAWTAKPSGHLGAPQKHTDIAISTAGV